MQLQLEASDSLAAELARGFSVTLHLCCCFELVLGVDPAASGVVSTLLADGTRMEAIMNHSHNTSVSVLSR